MQNDIIFGMLMLLIKNRSLTRDYLAEHYEISTRTVSRYMAWLEGAGIPVVSTVGVHGGFSLPDDYKLDKAYLAPEERKRLLACLESTKDGYNDKLNGQISDKLKALGSQQEIEEFTVKSSSLVIDAGPWQNLGDYRRKIQLLNKAIDGNFLVRLKYLDLNEFATSRTFEPYCIVLKDNIWYTYGYCRLRKDFRLFKLSRIRDIFIDEDRFVPRPFDVSERLNGTFVKEEDLIDFEIEFSSTVRSDVEEWLGIDAVSEKGMALSARATAPNTAALVKKLLSFGADVKILSPLSLRSDILEECQRVLDFC